MKIVSIVGVRPQFVKLFPVSRALRLKHQEVVVHTGQHYDFLMSDIFLRELDLPTPDYNLDVGSGSHAEQTSAMMIGLERVFAAERPDVVMVFGDTNSTLAAALTASKMRVPIAHVEAGLRSFNRAMPEEINRVVTDHVSDLLFCPTTESVENLRREGITRGVSQVGDVMLDAALHFGRRASLASPVLAPLRLEPGRYLLATIHRASSTDSPANLAALLDAFAATGEEVVFPLHPRTRHAIAAAGLTVGSNVRAIDPVGYLDMLALEKHARMVLTDSGGVQKEAYFFAVPCVTLRTDTEWNELVDAGWSRLVGFEHAAIVGAVKHWRPAGAQPAFYGQGHAGTQISERLGEWRDGLAKGENW